MNSGPEGLFLETEAQALPHRGAFSLRRFGGDAALVVGAGAVANIFGYIFHFLISRRLGPELYGTLVTLMAVAMMLGVLGSSMGTVAMQETARMWTSHLDSAIAPFLRRTGVLAAAIGAIIALLLALASLIVGPYVHVTQPILWLMVAVYVAAALFNGFARGAAQGAHRFGIFGASLIFESAAKVAIACWLVTLAFGIAGALGGLIAGSLIGLAIAYAPMALGGERAPWIGNERLRLGGQALNVLGITAAANALLFIDMLFAKHHFSAAVAGYFGAAGTLARTLPFGVGLIALVVMPKAAAARHASRASLAHVLSAAAGAAAAAVFLGVGVLLLFGRPIMTVTYGNAFASALPLVRLYVIDEALLALWLMAIGYLLAVARYTILPVLTGAVVLEALCFALFGSTPVRLLSIAIIANALLLPVAWAFALRTLRDAPQASGPPAAEAPV